MNKTERIVQITNSIQEGGVSRKGGEGREEHRRDQKEKRREKAEGVPFFDQVIQSVTRTIELELGDFALVLWMDRWMDR
jgi:hypothetical protein